LKLRQHIFVKDSGDENAIVLLAVEDDMTSLFHTADARLGGAEESSLTGLCRKQVATLSHLDNITSRLILATFVVCIGRSL
jgi:hypothetical protein